MYLLDTFNLNFHQFAGTIIFVSSLLQLKPVSKIQNKIIVESDLSLSYFCIKSLPFRVPLHHATVWQKLPWELTVKF